MNLADFCNNYFYINSFTNKEVYVTFELNSFVKVLNDNGVYNTYPGFFDHDNFRQYKSRYIQEGLPKNHIFQIKGFFNHSRWNDETLFIIEDQSTLEIFLIDKRYLEKYVPEF